MNGREAQFLGSAVHPTQYPKEGLPEIALVGRSNVGKSSFINSMLNRKNLARTSSKPGKTATLNFYKVDHRFLFVDLPGYGYAAVSKREREAWIRMMERYLTRRKELILVIQLVDIRHPPSQLDLSMRDFLRRLPVKTLWIATKADKISRNAWAKQMRVIKEGLHLEEGETLIRYSSETKEGREEVWDFLLAALSPIFPNEEKSPDQDDDDGPPFGEEKGQSPLNRIIIVGDDPEKEEA